MMGFREEVRVREERGRGEFDVIILFFWNSVFFDIFGIFCLF